MSMISELWAFLRTRKKYWLWPIFLMMALLGEAVRQGGVIASPMSWPNRAFDRSAGQRGWPVPSSLRSSAPGHRER